MSSANPSKRSPRGVVYASTSRNPRPVLHQIGEMRQVPGHDPHPLVVRGIEEGGGRLGEHERGRAGGVGRLQVQRAHAVRRHVCRRCRGIGPCRFVVDVDPHPEALERARRGIGTHQRHVERRRRCRGATPASPARDRPGRTRPPRPRACGGRSEPHVPQRSHGSRGRVPAPYHARVMDLGLSDAVAIVTASSKGLGLGTAKALSARGSEGGPVRPRRGCLQAAADALPGETLAVAADVTDPATPARLVDAAWNASGRSTSWSPTPAVPPGPRARDRRRGHAGRGQREHADVDPSGGARRPHLRAAGWGRICLITSNAVKQPIPTSPTRTPRAPACGRGPRPPPRT